MPDRPRHKYDHWEKLLSSLEDQGWNVWLAGNSHYRAHCPGDCKHHVSIPSTPRARSRTYPKKISQLKNYTCWEMDL